jgi:hypothetical protein
MDGNRRPLPACTTNLLHLEYVQKSEEAAMKTVRSAMYRTALLFFLLSFLNSASFSELSVKEIVEKNIQAAGGKEALARVKNFSFQSGSKTYYLSSSGELKITEGKKPVITEVILVDEEKARRNCFNILSEYEGIEKAAYQIMARLRSGLFTLAHFEDQLKFQGSTTFGPKKHYMLTSKVDDLEVEFYLDTDDYTLKRVVMKGYDAENNKYEVNNDFGPYQETAGIRIPSSWFRSQVGTRGQLHEITDVKLNPALDKDFFSTLAVNVGEVGIAEGTLNGNIVEFTFQRGMLIVGTNWTKKCMLNAGFKAKNKLILQINDREIEVDFYDASPSRGEIGPGAKFILPNRQSENYLVYLWSQEYQKLAEELEPLLPIRLKRK